MLTKTSCAARFLRSTGVTPLPHYYEPSRHPLAFHRFPGFRQLYGFPAPPISRRDEEGFSSCLAGPGHRAVPSTPPEDRALQSVCARPCCLHRWKEGSASGVLAFRGHLWVHFCYGPVTCSPSQGWLCRLASSASFPPHGCNPSCGALTFTPVGLSPTEHASLDWTHVPPVILFKAMITQRTRGFQLFRTTRKSASGRR